MKTLLTLSICLLTLTSAKAQAFQNGGNYITLGFGFDPYGNAGGGNSYKHLSLGPIILCYERGITELLGIGRIGVGGGVAQTFYTSTYSYNHPVWGYNYEEKYTRSRTSLIIKAAYHFDFGIDKMDVYAGIGGAVHFYNDSYKYSTSDPDPDPDDYYNYNRSDVGGGHYVFVGIRYYFTDAFGVYAEAGHGISALNGGFVFAF